MNKSKSILIIDTPRCCENCPCCSEDGDLCKILDKIIRDINIECEKPGWCPLMEMPEKHESYVEGCKACLNAILTEALNKLAEYEELEKKGKLLKVPCKIGDTIYVIPSNANYKLNIVNRHEENNRVYAQVVDRIEIFESGRYLLSTCDGMASVIEQFYKETWFLTEKEAETALQKLNGTEGMADE